MYFNLKNIDSAGAVISDMVDALRDYTGEPHAGISRVGYIFQTRYNEDGDAVGASRFCGDFAGEEKFTLEPPLAYMSFDFQTAGNAPAHIVLDVEPLDDWRNKKTEIRFNGIAKEVMANGEALADFIYNAYAAFTATSDAFDAFMKEEA